MSHENHHSNEGIVYGPFFYGSTSPSKIVEFPDKSSQIIWRDSGARVEFDESSVIADPYAHDSHKGIVYRLTGETEVTEVCFTSAAVVVFQRPDYQTQPTSVRVYSRDGVDRNYDPPKKAVVGEPLNLLSGLCSGELKAVNELITSFADADDNDRDKPAYQMLYGFDAFYGMIEDCFPNTALIRSEKPSTIVPLIEVAEERLLRAVDKVGIIAVQSNGVVVR